MAVKHTKFLGASVANFSANVGWNAETGSLTIQLAEDKSSSTKYYYSSYDVNGVLTTYGTAQSTTAADSFNPPQIGAPVHFRFEDFVFNGILQSWERKLGPNGEFYEVTINSVVDVLNNVEVIIGGYSGGVGGIRNLINVYGYYENILGFGASNVNEAGMPATTLKSGLYTLINGSPTTYSGKIKFKGYGYKVNIQDLPVMPNYYRVPGNSVNLTDLISQLCADSGYDYIATLTFDPTSGNVIGFKTVSRQANPTLTALSGFIEGSLALASGTQRDRGLELRNETVNALAIGGQKQMLYTVASTLDANPANNTIWPYWGLDASGNAIIGSGYGDAHRFSLDSRKVNCSGVGAAYSCSVGELRAVLAGMDSWMQFLSINEPLKASGLGIPNVFGSQQFMKDVLTRGKGNAVDLTNTTTQRLEFFQNETKQESYTNLFAYLGDVANEYYGKKFMVRTPFVTATTEPDTLRTVTSYEPSDGGYLERADWLAGNQPLGLLSTYNHRFTHEDGRFHPFVKFIGTAPVTSSGFGPYDLKDIHPESLGIEIAGVNTLVSGSPSVYSVCVKSEIDSQYVYGNAFSLTDPRVVLTLPGPVNNRTVASGDLMGAAKLILQAIMSANGRDPINDTPTAIEKRQAALVTKENGSLAGGWFLVDYGPAAVMPQQVCVPLLSNIETYGPWYADADPGSGIDGKVRYQQFPELVPWNFNGYTWLDNAGNAQVVDVIAAQQVGEMGTVQLAGSPICQLGDALVNGGPNVTSIEVSVGEQITTNYRMRTYTRSFGNFSKQNADRFQRLSRTARQNELKTLERINSVDAIPTQFFSARERAILSQIGPKGLKHGTPHNVIISTFTPHNAYPSGDAVHSGVVTSFCTLEEGLRAIETGSYGTFGITTLDALFAPYSSYSGAREIPHFEKPIYSGDLLGIRNNNIITSMAFNSFNHGMALHHTGIIEHPIAGYGSGGRYPESGLQTIVNQNITEARMVGFKGPMIVTGWGYDLWGRPIPNSGDLQLGPAQFPNMNVGPFTENFKNKPYTWKTGPLNMRWNPLSKVWDSPYALFKGIYLGNVGGTGILDHKGIRLPIADFYDISDVSSGVRMICGFVEDELTVISVEC